MSAQVTSGKVTTSNAGEAPKLDPMEWSIGASPHLYGSRPVRSYIIEVTLDAPVEETPLQEAVDKTVERMPYYLQTFACEKGLYYDAKNDLPLTIAHSAELRQLGTAEVNWHMIDVTYDGGVIYFAAAHALADGESFTNFVQTVLYYYFCAKDHTTYSSKGIVTLETPRAEDELVDVFAQKRKSYVFSLARTVFNTHSALPENKQPYPDYRTRYPLRVPTNELLGWAKGHGASPASAVAGMIAKAVMRENPTLRGKLTVCVQISMRRLLGVPHTLKNCVGAAYLPFDKKTVVQTPTGQLASEARASLREQLTEEYANKMAGMQSFAFRAGKLIRPLRNLCMGVLELCPFNTVSVDYAGRPAMGEYESQVKSISYYFSEVFKGSLYLIMSECAGSFLINFNQSFETDRYYRAFLRVLEEEHISYEELPAVRYLTPEVVQQH
ncbi:MAG: hypothetical protein Q4A07_13890 [Coriobacteriales bacterium]|nr:hypothetical protein [Coriobacteriales bacterium]